MDISTEKQQTFVKIGKIYPPEFQNFCRRFKDFFTELEDSEGKTGTKHHL